MQVENLNLRLGTDIVFIPRLEKQVNNQTFINKVLTIKEQEIMNSLESSSRKLEFLAGRFACKEAFAKALGTGIGETDFLDIEILRNDLGAPVSSQAQVSISHDGDYCIAVVMV